MSIILASMLAASTLLPQIDRATLDLQAQAESFQSNRAGRASRAGNGRSLDWSALATICRAAGRQPDPNAFLATLSRAYSMSPSEAAGLQGNCAGYFAGRAEARRASFNGTYR